MGERKNRKYTDSFKLEVVTEYLNGGRFKELLTKYEIGHSVLRQWVNQYKEFGFFPDNRGKSSKKDNPNKGRPKKIKVIKEDMTKDEYIKYLEMENDILKARASLLVKQSK